MRPARSAVNTHFGKVNETRQALGYLDALTIDDVLKSVLMATLKSSANLTLRDAYSQILDDLDDDKELTFAHMQQVCARQFRRRQERRPDTPRIDRTERATPRTSPAKPESKYKCTLFCVRVMDKTPRQNTGTVLLRLLSRDSA